MVKRQEKEYITFREMEHKGKTKKFAVVPLKNQEDILGIILWSGGWRSYVLEINERTHWSTGCLKQIYNFISKLKEDGIPPTDELAGILPKRL